jgi:hypothetical protein
VSLEEPEDCFQESMLFQELDGFEEKSICFNFVLEVFVLEAFVLEEADGLEEPMSFAFVLEAFVLEAFVLGTSLTSLFPLFPGKTGI